MSIESWKAEFYPIGAKDVPKQHALGHSIIKWHGLRKENLRKHGCRILWRSEVVDDAGCGLEIDANSCALCTYYWSHSGCGSCPLAIARGGVACDKERHDEQFSPYKHWLRTGNPMPMLGWLHLALDV